MEHRIINIFIIIFILGLSFLNRKYEIRARLTTTHVLEENPDSRLILMNKNYLGAQAVYCR